MNAYARMLGLLYPVYVEVERRTQSFREWQTLSPPLDLNRRRRAHFLAADLQALGVDAGTVRAVALPEIERFAHALGALYVVEGSRLGGQVIARQISATVGAAADGAFRFLRSEGSDVRQLWSELRAVLGSYAASADRSARDAVIAGALDTFRCFDQQLAMWEP